MADTPRRKAEPGFSASEARDALVRSETEKERAAFDIRTAKLRALRLEKEAAERAQKAQAKPAAPAARVRKKRAP